MSTTGVNRSKQMERLTTCPICLDKFRIPKLLPCMHTFCLTPCLTNLVDPRALSLRCPECRREHRIPQGGIQAFPANLTMMGFLDLPPPTTITEIPEHCFICKKQKQALIECHDCSKFHCTDCREPHLRETFYAITSSVSQLRRTLPQLSNKIASYEQRVNSVKTNYDQIRLDITSVIGALIEELKHREAALLTEAEVYMQSQLRTFRIQQETAEVELASVASFCESIGTSFPNGQLVNDADLANMRAQCTRYSEQINALQAQMPTDVQKLRLTFNNQAAISSSIQNFGQLIDIPREQQQQQRSQTSLSQSVQSQRQQPRFSSAAYPHAAAQYVTTSHNPITAPFQNDQYRHLENVYYSSGSTTLQLPSLSQTIGSRPTQNQISRNTDNSFVDLNATAPPRMNTTSYTAAWEAQSPRRSTSNIQSTSLFGPNPFSSTNRGSTQRPSVSQQPPPPQPEPTPRRNYVTSTTAARSLEGDDRPIFGGSGRGGAVVAGRGRGRFASIAPIPEQEVSTNGIQRQRTFVLNEPSLPNLPQSGAQRPRDTVIVPELYNVRRRNRARTPVAFTVNLNETPRSSNAGVTDSGTV